VGDKVTAGVPPALAPVPVRETVCGLPVALSVIETFAVRVPAAVGVKVTLIVQLALAFTLPPQVLVSAKSPLLVPVIAMLVRESAAEPLLVSVTFCAALVVFTVWLAKVRLAGDSVTAGVPPALAPVPVRETVCGLPVALSVIETFAVREPAAVGVNVKLTVQLALAFTLPPQVLVSAKSPLLVPVIAILERESAAVPLLVSVTFCATLVVFTVWLAKVRLVGDKVTAGVPPALAPVPVRETVCGLPVALSVMETFALREPAAVGLNVTFTVQLALAFTLPPQVLVAEKSPLFVPVIVMLVRERAAEPLLVSVTPCAALVVFTVWLAKVKLPGDIKTAGVPPPPPPAPDDTKPLQALRSRHIPARVTPRAPG
jgi:hypothetical protein